MKNSTKAFVWRYWVKIDPLPCDTGSPSIFFDTATGKYHEIFPVYYEGHEPPTGYQTREMIRKEVSGRRGSHFLYVSAESR